MATTNIVGEIDGISDAQLEFVLNVFSKYGDQNQVLFENVGKKGDNFLANVKRIIKHINSDEKLSIIAKFAPTNAAVREMIQTAIVFKNESVAYKDVFEKFQELQVRFKLPEEYLFKFPKCYGTLDEEPNEVILLEDLNERDYVVLNKFDILSSSTIKVILKSIAVYNAMSFAYKKYDSKSFENNVKHLRNIFDVDSDAINEIENFIISLVNSGERKNHMKDILSDKEGFRKINNEDRNAPRSVILHGDAWTNNFLFKLQDGQPESCILIDYQGARIGNTAFDLLFMLLSCSDHKSRVEHFHDWINYYYTELNGCLRHFGLKAQTELPREDLENDLKRYGKAAFSRAAIITFFTNREASEVTDVKKGVIEADKSSLGIDGMSEATVSKLKAKYQGMYDTCVHFNLLD